MIIIISGPPGSGKSLVSQQLARELGVGLLPSGSVLRRSCADRQKAGIETRRYWSKGNTIPAGLVYQALLPSLQRLDFDKGFVSDGYPLTWNDWLLFRDLVYKKQSGVDVFVSLEVSEEVCRRRIASRSGREDDRKEALDRRFDHFKEVHSPLKKYFKEQGKLLLVSALGPPTAVVERILEDLPGK